MRDVTVWNCFIEDDKSILTISTNNNQPQQFHIKAVCYSPCPIGGSNNYTPNIGDWFWDSVPGVTNWEGTWSNDLQLIKDMGANSVRVYCFMEKQLQENSQTLFTHKSFLDLCYSKGIYVIVGIPLPRELFINGQTASPSNGWWEDELLKTVTEVADHPAVLGFTIANEVDSKEDTYAGPGAAYWWGQVEKMAAISKNAAPNKLVGIANHDDPGICQNAATFMAQCNSIVFWGVNTYQPQSFISVFGEGSTPGYSTLPDQARKPVLVTEYGFPATSRKTEDTLDPSKIYSDVTTQQNVADVLDAMLSKAYNEPINLGLCYFEFCDEWWNQSAYKIDSNVTCPDAFGPNAPNSGVGGSFQPPCVYSPYGGPIACGFPNYYWDNDGFGLFEVAIGPGRDPSNPWDSSNNAPALPLDTRTPRTAIIQSLMSEWIKWT